jgi:hypothetical protein
MTNKMRRMASSTMRASSLSLSPNRRGCAGAADTTITGFDLLKSRETTFKATGRIHSEAAMVTPDAERDGIFIGEGPANVVMHV